MPEGALLTGTLEGGPVTRGGTPEVPVGVTGPPVVLLEIGNGGLLELFPISLLDEGPVTSGLPEVPLGPVTGPVVVLFERGNGTLLELDSTLLVEDGPVMSGGVPEVPLGITGPPVVLLESGKGGLLELEATTLVEDGLVTSGTPELPLGPVTGPPVVLFERGKGGLLELGDVVEFEEDPVVRGALELPVPGRLHDEETNVGPAVGTLVLAKGAELDPDKAGIPLLGPAVPLDVRVSVMTPVNVLVRCRVVTLLEETGDPETDDESPDGAVTLPAVPGEEGRLVAPYGGRGGGV